MTRGLGDALGIVILGTAFAGAGGIGSPASFTEGFAASKVAAATLLLSGALAGLTVPLFRRAETEAATAVATEDLPRRERAIPDGTDQCFDNLSTGVERGIRVRQEHLREESPANGGVEPPPAATITVPIDSLLAGYSPRLDGEDDGNIRRLAEIDSPLPPILVHRQTMRVIDGMHRIEAARKKGVTEIEVVFFDGDETEAFYLAVEANTAHGLPLTLSDRKAAAVRMIKSNSQMSDRAIARWAGLAAKTVAKLRNSSEVLQQSNTRLGMDGRQRPLDRTDGRRRAAEFLGEHPDASLREIAKAARISVGTARDVRERLRHGEDPVRRRKPSGSGLPRGAGPEKRTAVESLRRLPLPIETRAEMLAKVLHGLQKDPSLRLSEPGRDFIRWAHLQVYWLEKRSSIVAAIPPHHADTVASMVRECARELMDFAQEVAERGKVSEP